MWHALADGIGVLMASHVFFGECGVLGGFFVLLFFFGEAPQKEMV